MSTLSPQEAAVFYFWYLVLPGSSDSFDFRSEAGNVFIVDFILRWINVRTNWFTTTSCFIFVFHVRRIIYFPTSKVRMIINLSLRHWIIVVFTSSRSMCWSKASRAGFRGGGFRQSDSRRNRDWFLKVAASSLVQAWEGTLKEDRSLVLECQASRLLEFQSSILLMKIFPWPKIDFAKDCKNIQLQKREDLHPHTAFRNDT